MLSDIIKSLRKKKGLSQAQIAIKLGITQGAVSQWENGLTEPAVDQLIALAKIFDVSLYDLKGVDEPEIKKEPAEAGLDDGLRERISRLSPQNLGALDAYIDLLLISQDSKAPSPGSPGKAP